MKTGESAKNFIASVILLAKIQTLIKDDFFYSRFTDKIFDFGLDFFNFSEEDHKDDAVRRQILIEKCLFGISGLIDIFKELRYLGLVKNTPLLLKAESSLLIVRLGILQRIKELSVRKEEITEKIKKEVFKKIEIVVPKNRTENQKLTPSKKKILDYIKSYPNTRTKDIIYEFSALSGRSVKRNLTDLIKSGLVNKRVDNKAVYYYANDVQS